MRPAENINKMINKLELKASARLDEKVHDTISTALDKSKQTTSATVKPGVWSTIMKNRKRRVVAAVVIGVAVVAISFMVGFGEPAYAQTVRTVRTTIARLKDILTRSRQSPPERSVVRRRIVKGQATHLPRDYHIVSTKLGVFSVQDRERLLEEQGIQWMPVIEEPNAILATLTAEAAMSFIEIWQSSEAILSRQPLQVPGLLYNGKVHDYIYHDRDSAFALGGVILDQQNQVELDVSFYDGKLGFEITDIRLTMGQVLLIQGQNTASTGEQSSDRGVLWYIQPLEVLALPE